MEAADAHPASPTHLSKPQQQQQLTDNYYETAKLDDVFNLNSLDNDPKAQSPPPAAPAAVPASVTTTPSAEKKANEKRRHRSSSPSSRSSSRSRHKSRRTVSSVGAAVKARAGAETERRRRRTKRRSSSPPPSSAASSSSASRRSSSKNKSSSQTSTSTSSPGEQRRGGGGGAKSDGKRRHRRRSGGGGGRRRSSSRSKSNSTAASDKKPGAAADEQSAGKTSSSTAAAAETNRKRRHSWTSSSSRSSKSSSTSPERRRRPDKRRSPSRKRGAGHRRSRSKSESSFSRSRTRSRDRRTAAASAYYRHDYHDYADKRYYGGQSASKARFYGDYGRGSQRSRNPAPPSSSASAQRYYSAYYDAKRSVAAAYEYDYKYDYYGATAAYDYEGYYDYYYKDKPAVAGYYEPPEPLTTTTGAPVRPATPPPPPGASDTLETLPQAPRVIKTPPLPDEAVEDTGDKKQPELAAGDASCYLYDDLKSTAPTTPADKKPKSASSPPPPSSSSLGDKFYLNGYPGDQLNQCQEISSSTLAPGYAQHPYYRHHHHHHHHQYYAAGGHYPPPPGRYSSYSSYYGKDEYDWPYYGDKYYAHSSRSYDGALYGEVKVDPTPASTSAAAAAFYAAPVEPGDVEEATTAPKDELEVKKGDEKGKDEFEDILAYKEKLQSQLKKSLFKDKPEEAAASLAALTGEQSTRHSSPESESEHGKRSKHHRSEKDKSARKHKKKKDKSREKEARKSSKEKSEKGEKKLSDESFDSQDLRLLDDELSLRRSDRIRTIESKRQFTKEQEIAEKIRKHGHHGHHHHHGGHHEQDELSNDGLLVGKEPPRTPPEPSEPPIEETDKTPPTPLKVKDRWRRCSEKEQSTPASPVPETPPPPPKPPGSVKAACGSQISSPTINSNNSTLTTLDEKDYFGKDYQQIDENIYHSKRKRKAKLKKEAKRMTCDCSTSEQERAMGIVACGEDCLNRLLMIECGKRCPCGEFCTNRHFQRRHKAPLAPFRTQLKGWGLRALVELKPGAFLIEYVGEVIGVKEFKRRCEKYSTANNEHFYFMSLYNDLFIDATRKGNISRFFNHSCDPNCETQKWTVNGELRIGFFTRRPVAANEELTFDYQFQTYGKKQQKCYCGSDKCRGFLGASAAGSQAGSQQQQALDSIWNEESSEEEDDEDEDDEEDEENEENEEAAPKTQKEDKKKRSKRDDKDHEVNRMISSIGSLSNKESVLKLCRLMYRTEDVANRVDILNLLLSSESDASLRLFIDYHGLKLLWSWMIDLDSQNESASCLECKAKCLHVLAKMSIKNRNVLEECKLLPLVKRWSEATTATVAETEDLLADESGSHAWLGRLVAGVADKAVASSIERNQAAGATPSSQPAVELTASLRALADQAKELYTEWSNLKQSFKIPKKQRIRERKEHERELGSLVKSPSLPDDEHDPFGLAAARSPASPYATPGASYPHSSAYYDQSYYYDYYGRGAYQYDAADYYYPYRSRRSYGASSAYYSGRRARYDARYDNYRNNPNLSKEERRKMFEESIRQQEAEAAAAAAANPDATDGLHAGPAAPDGLEPAEALEQQRRPGQEMKWVFDSHKQQWIQCYVPVSHSGVYSGAHYQDAADRDQRGGAGGKESGSGSLGGISLTDSHFNELKQAMMHFMPPAFDMHGAYGDHGESKEQPQHKALTAAAAVEAKTILSPSPTASGSPLDAMVASIKNKLDRDQSHQASGRDEAKEKSQNAQLDALAAKLPPDWKCKANKAGRVYFYNIKTQRTQWEFPKPAKPSGVAAGAVKPADESFTITSTTSEASTAPKDADKSAAAGAESNMLSSSSTDAAFKIFKDQFREKLSKLVISLLQPYLRKDCKAGHIANTDDFKHLARKFTHVIMEKEMSRATKLEELDLNKRIRIKTEDYVSKYMAKFTSGYVRDDQNMSL